MSSLLTWHRSAANSPPLSDYATTVQGYMQQLDAAFDSMEAESGSYWEVCSSELTTAPYYITLKRKTGSAGRILFMGFTGTVSPLNPQLLTYAVAANQVAVAFFPEATSDTPANINSSSGDVFTNPGRTTGLSAHFYDGTGANRFRIYDCADGVFVNRFDTSPVMYFFAGDLVEDKAEVAVPCVSRIASNFLTMTPPAVVSNNTSSIISSDADGRFFLGWGVVYDVGYVSNLNDTSNKEAYFLPNIAASPQRRFADWCGYKMRQVGLCYTPASPYDTLVVSGPEDAAYHVSATGTPAAGMPWLTNFKV